MNRIAKHVDDGEIIETIIEAEVPSESDLSDLLCDDNLRKIWVEAGGFFHGPIIETAVMTEESLLCFLRKLIEDTYERGIGDGNSEGY